jgi:FixJ family two-component response regulator
MADLIETVFVVDPDASVRATLDVLIRRAGRRPATFHSAQDFFASPSPAGPACLLLGLPLSDCDGCDLLDRIAIERKAIAAVVMSSPGDVALIVRVMKAGAVDFLAKPLSLEPLMAAIGQALARSRAVLSREAALFELRERYDSLSSREREVMAGVVAGSLNKQVGSALGISIITVKAHRGRVMRKMGASSLADLVTMALKLRLPLPPIARTARSAIARASDGSTGVGNGSAPIRIRPANVSRRPQRELATW